MKESKSYVPEIFVEYVGWNKRGLLFSVYYLGKEIATRERCPYLAACRWFEASNMAVSHIKDQHGSLIDVQKGASLDLIETAGGFVFRKREDA